MKKTILAFILVAGGGISIRAQSIGPATINSSGGTGIIGTNEFDWSVGEMVLVSTFTGTSIIVTQGVLQNHEMPTGIDNYTEPKTNLLIFPNPATTEVCVKYTAVSDGTLSFKLMDMSGKIVEAETLNIKAGINSKQISLAGLPSATYLLETIIHAGASVQEHASYRIQKLK